MLGCRNFNHSMFKNTDHGGIDLFFILFPENKKWNYIFTLNFEINYFNDTNKQYQLWSWKHVLQNWEENSYVSLKSSSSLELCHGVADPS